MITATSHQPRPQPPEQVIARLRDKARHSFRMANVMWSMGNEKLAEDFEDRGRKQMNDARTAELYARRRG